MTLEIPPPPPVPTEPGVGVDAATLLAVQNYYLFRLVTDQQQYIEHSMYWKRRTFRLHREAAITISVILLLVGFALWFIIGPSVQTLAGD